MTSALLTRDNNVIMRISYLAVELYLNAKNLKYKMNIKNQPDEDEYSNIYGIEYITRRCRIVVRVKSYTTSKYNPSDKVCELSLYIVFNYDGAHWIYSSDERKFIKIDKSDVSKYKITNIHLKSTVIFVINALMDII
jgi:hypothetical protein